MTRAIAADPAGFGFIEATVPCYAGAVTEHGVSCADPDAHVFWDGDHLSHAAHRLIAAKAVATVGDRAE